MAWGMEISVNPNISRNILRIPISPSRIKLTGIAP